MNTHARVLNSSFGLLRPAPNKHGASKLWRGRYNGHGRENARTELKSFCQERLNDERLCMTRALPHADVPVVAPNENPSAIGEFATMQHTFEQREPCEVVVVSEFDVAAKSLGSVLESNGYAVLHATTFQESRDFACKGRADAIILMSRAAEMSSVDFCRRLHGDPDFDATTPLLVVTSGDCTRTERLEVLSAGAWETSPEPLDGELLLLKLQPFMRMRRAVGKLSKRCLIDAATGLYNLEGMIRRSNEVAALSLRRKQPFAIVAIETSTEKVGTEEGMETQSLLSNTSAWCRNSTRATDTLGRVAENRICCIAPDADPRGARSLVNRLHMGLNRQFADRVASGAASFKAGFCATPSFGMSEIGAVDMLFRAVELAANSDPGQAIGESV